MPKHSAGILLYRKASNGYEVLLVHPGGPFWAKKDAGAWSMPKGEVDSNEELLTAAKREFKEEIGSPAPDGEYEPMGDFTPPGMMWPGYKQPGGKIVHAFVLEADFNLEHFTSNTFEMEWPPKSGKKQEFPENDRAAWVPLAEASAKVTKGQVPLIESLAEHVGAEVSSREQATLF